MEQRLPQPKDKTIEIQPIPGGVSLVRRKPFYKQWWFWAIVVAGVGGGIAATQMRKEEEGPGEIDGPPGYPDPPGKR